MKKFLIFYEPNDLVFGINNAIYQIEKVPLQVVVERARGYVRKVEHQAGILGRKRLDGGKYESNSRFDTSGRRVVKIFYHFEGKLLLSFRRKTSFRPVQNSI